MHIITSAGETCYVGYNSIKLQEITGRRRQMEDREKFYVMKSLREIFESRLYGPGSLDYSDSGLRMLKRYIWDCIENENEEDLGLILKACMVLPEMKEWILNSKNEALEPVQKKFKQLCDLYDPGELAEREDFLPFT
jgi:hypothetical protein